jgi:hypothetical protein
MQGDIREVLAIVVAATSPAGLATEAIHELSRHLPTPGRSRHLPHLRRSILAVPQLRQRSPPPAHRPASAQRLDTA